MNKKNNIALVTGASRGIGKNIALALIKLGIYVIGTAKTKDGTNKINKMFDEKKGIGIKIDFLNIKKYKEKIKKIIAKIGIIDILIHNAGIIHDNLLIKMNIKEWNDVINVNLSSIFYLSKIIVPNMLKKKFGRIIIINSVTGYLGQIGQTNYAASKSGLIGFMRSLALEIASRNITVNLIAPGYIITDMTKKILLSKKRKIMKRIPTKNFGTPSDITHAVLFLISIKSSYITGQTIHVNGGMYMP
ncbi:3-oxoacyl-[acyl-carrier protein] reductase [Buchnera aphidicola (Cinara tujafilina)]|uniref:3-oxoacyl-[acyl-carrier-protein] reductase FabG n=1 Tax=Buchnera aphidicola (Cinara tujafilina) TaxID=261317 RepID=F7WZE9_9GAMM|nr:3-oxoacyl-ACP reductase FabG [Buchnera aphidicola]AEH39811.1 3-oxoacyl-[acyl-carrier protein] reductase [Buchnera aphidicola (Cinara tujafilina)]